MQQRDHILEELLGQSFILTDVVIQILVDLDPDLLVGHLEVGLHDICVIAELMIDIALGL